MNTFTLVAYYSAQVAKISIPTTSSTADLRDEIIKDVRLAIKTPVELFTKVDDTETLITLSYDTPITNYKNVYVRALGTTSSVDTLVNKNLEAGVISVFQSLYFGTSLYFRTQSHPIIHYTSRGNFIKFSSQILGDRWTINYPIYQNHNGHSFTPMKHFVLFMDEFDLVHNAETDVLHAIIGDMRGIRESKAKSSLYSFVGVGPFGILTLLHLRESPFNSNSSIQPPTFSRDQTLQLFTEYALDRPTIDTNAITEVATDIYQKTNGHAGHTALCGKFLDLQLYQTSDYYPLGDGQINISAWRQYYLTHFIQRDVGSWATTKALGSLIFRKFPEIKTDSETNQLRLQTRLCEFLVQYAFPSSKSFTCTDTSCQDLLEYLMEEGIITCLILPETYSFASDLVRTLITLKFDYSTLQVPPLYEALTPIYTLGKLDIIQILTLAFKAITPKEVERGFTVMYKGNRSTGSPCYSRDELVPHEYFFHFNIYFIMRVWLRSRAVVLSEAKTIGKNDGSKKKNREKDGNDKNITEHLAQVNEYAKSLNASPYLVIITSLRDIIKPKPFDQLPVGIVEERSTPILHLQHDRSFQVHSCESNRHLLGSKSMQDVQDEDMDDIESIFVPGYLYRKKLKAEIVLGRIGVIDY
eukprot:gene6596-7660_t